MLRSYLGRAPRACSRGPRYTGRKQLREPPGDLSWFCLRIRILVAALTSIQIVCLLHNRRMRSWRPLLEKRGIKVRAVNLRVAQHARLEEARLVVERRRSRRAAEA